MNIADYIDHLAGKGLADRTIGEYRLWVRRAMSWCADRGYQLDTLPAHLLRAWADSLPYTWSTRKQAKAALRHYYRAVGRGHEAPWEAIRQPAKPKPRPNPHDATEARLLRDAALLRGGREGLAVLLLLFTGARAAEVAGMRWEQIDMRRGIIEWHRPKVSDSHGLPIEPPLRDAVVRHGHGGRGPIFVGNNGRPTVQASTIWTWTKQVAGMAGLDTSPKRLRSTVGNLVLEATGDLDAAASILGHVSTDTTRSFYTDDSPRRVAAGMAALSEAFSDS